MALTDFLRTIERWWQKEEDQLLYEPDGMPVDDGVYYAHDPGQFIQHEGAIGFNNCPCVHCRQWRDEEVLGDIPLPEIDVVSYEVSTLGIAGQPFGEAWEELARRINARNGRA